MGKRTYEWGRRRRRAGPGGEVAGPALWRQSSRDRTLDRENLLLLLLSELVHLGDELVGGLLDLLVAAPLLVLGDLLVLGERLELVVGVTPHVADSHPRVLRELANRLGKLLAALLGQGR